MTLKIPTERSGVTLRQFIPQDARPLFALIDCNRAHLSQYLDETADKYPDYNSVLRSITHPPNPTKLRFGVWDDKTLVGTVNLKRQDKMTELGYWIGSQYTRKGYALLASRALCEYAMRELGCRSIVAFVHKDNIASQEVLRRCGFEFWHKMLKSKTAVSFRKTV